MKFVPIQCNASITGFESPAASYTQLGLSLDDLLILHPTATVIGIAQGEPMVELGIFDGDLLICDRSTELK